MKCGMSGLGKTHPTTLPLNKTCQVPFSWCQQCWWWCTWHENSSFLHHSITNHPWQLIVDHCWYWGNENSIYLPNWASSGMVLGLATLTLHPANRCISTKVGTTQTGQSGTSCTTILVVLNMWCSLYPQSRNDIFVGIRMTRGSSYR